MQNPLSSCHAATLKDSPPLPCFMNFFIFLFFVALLQCQGVKSNKDEKQPGRATWDLSSLTSSD